MQLKSRFSQLKVAIAAAELKGSLLPKVESLEEDYDRLCTYALNGVEDPERTSILEDIQARLASLEQQVERHNNILKASTLYFNTLRYRNMVEVPLKDTVYHYEEALDKLNLMSLTTENPDDKKAWIDKAEMLESQAFNTLWTQFPLLSASKEVLHQTLASPSFPLHFKGLLLSALLMGLWEYWDEERMQVLIDVYENQEEESLQIKALCGILLGLWKNGNRPLSRKLSHRFDLLNDNPMWENDVKMALLQFIRTRETEKATRQFNENIFPEIKRFRQEIKESQDEENFPVDPYDPKWQEILQASGLEEKLREMMEMQQDGVDVLMPMFRNIKQMPFFNNISNWFLPFHLNHSMVNDPAKLKLAQMLESGGGLCNTDKFGFIMTLDLVPESQKNMLMEQLEAQNIQDGEDTEGHYSRERLTNLYVRDLNRFFNLFRRSGEFKNPFSQPLNLTSLPVLGTILNDEETLRLVAEFYFNRHYYEEALPLFLQVNESNPSLGDVCQKIGFCYENLKNYRQALHWYETAQSLGESSKWMVRRCAICHRALKEYSQAAHCYEELASEKAAVDSTLEMSIGHCYLAMENYDEALKHYYKGEFSSSSGSDKFLRPIAWASLMAGKLDVARERYESIVFDMDKATASDLLNAGHLETLTGNFRQAVLLYRCARHKNPDFLNDFKADTKLLLSRGVSPEIIDIMLDQL